MDAAREAELLARARNGDQNAFMELVEPQVQRLRAHCQRMLRDPYLAQDALQEAILRAWEKLWGCRDSFPGWLYTITNNVCLDMLRSAYFRHRAPLDEQTADPNDPVSDPKIWGIDLDQALAQLKPEEQDLFDLHIRYGYNLQECAEILKITYSAARKRFERIVKKLTRWLRPDPPPWGDQPKGDDGPHA